jgi:hypothetical protein
VHRAFLGMSSLIPTRNGMSSAHDRPVVERYAERVTVKCLTVPTLLTKHSIVGFDILHIDVEGYDWMVLKQFDLHRFRPKVVRLEQSSLAPDEAQAARALLMQNDYQVVDFYDELVGIRN